MRADPVWPFADRSLVYPFDPNLPLAESPLSANGTDPPNDSTLGLPLREFGSTFISGHYYLFVVLSIEATRRNKEFESRAAVDTNIAHRPYRARRAMRQHSECHAA